MASTYQDRARINELTDQAVGVVDDILNEFDVRYKKNQRRYYGPCPIHGGDNPLAFNLYPDGYDVRGIWNCHTRHCEKEWKKTFVGLIHALLSRDCTKPIHWSVALNWLVKYLGYSDFSDIKLPDEYTLKRRTATSAAEKWSLAPIRSNTGWSRLQVRESLLLPANYYVNRGFSADTLDRYDVGTYNRQERVVVPIYDDDYQYAVGFTKRSLYEKCEECGWFHGGGACKEVAKWEHSDGFQAASWLYNYWFAKRHIAESNVAVLVEGPGDTWRLEEAGIQNAVAMFGTDLAEDQVGILEMSGALSLIVMLDNDEAGRQAAKILQSRLNRTFRLYFPKFAGDDIGEMLNKDEVTSKNNYYVQRLLDGAHIIDEE